MIGETFISIEKIAELSVERTAELTPVQHDLLRMLRAAVAGHAPEVPPADWAPVLDLAHLHQVDHYLYPIVRTWDSSFQPLEGLMLRWRTSFFGAIAQYTRASAQAAELLAALHAAGICVVPLKGIWLAENVYEDGTCRPMCDFDLLVPPEELDRARVVFDTLGYTTPDHFLDLKHDKHVHYQHADRPMTIELHWRLRKEREIQGVGDPDSTRIWSDLHEELLHGVPVQVFLPNRQLVYLVQHIQHHAMTVPLRAYLDLILLCRRYAPQFDPSRLDAEAQAWQVPFGTRFLIQVASDIYGVDLPTSVGSFLPDSGAFKDERQAALCAALQLNGESGKLIPLMEDYQQASCFHFFKVGLSRLFIPPSMIRSGHPQAVRRFGLLGGYIARCTDLFLRRFRMRRMATLDDPAVKSDLENYNTRRELSAWLHAQDTQ